MVVTTLENCKTLNKPHFKVDMNKTPNYQIEKIDFWIQNNQIKTLNIAGPREDGSDIYTQANNYLINLLTLIFKKEYTYE